MAALETPKVNKNWPAPDFNLLGVDGKYYDLTKVRGERGTVIVFMCNHCPYVKAIVDKLIRDAKELESIGITLIGINSNDVEAYPEDSYDKMKIFAKENKIIFPYVIDQTQKIARKYDAVCTPDFFGFDKDLKLQYRGRLDSAGKEKDLPNTKRELFIAMKDLAEKNICIEEQIPSIGCSIKWKNKCDV